MERRDFFRAMLGAAALLPPSQVWPFRKIFIPSWLYQEPFTITTSFPHNLMAGDRVKIYRSAYGSGEYYLVKNVKTEGGIVLVQMPSPPDIEWLGLARSPWPKGR